MTGNSAPGPIRPDGPVVRYSANSDKARNKTEEGLPREPVEKIPKLTSGAVSRKKKSLGRKFKDMFTGEEASSVRHYLMTDVAIPAFKNFVYDFFSQGLQRSLWGTSRPTGGFASSVLGPNRTAYAAKFSGGGQSALPSGPTLSSRARATHDFDEIILESRPDAEEVRDALIDRIERYGRATVSDLYDAVGISSDYTDIKWGWENLSESTIEITRKGYLLRLPTPIELK